MKIIDFNEKYGEKSVVCLGRFDGLHIGHATIINKAKEIAKAKNLKVFTFCFDDDVLGDQKSLFTLDETAFKAEALGVDGIIKAPFTKEFFSVDKKAFLDILFENFSPEAIVCGKDYTFGYQKSGDTDFLADYCLEKGVSCLVLPILNVDGEKVATRDIKAHVQNGEVEKANALLGGYYFVKNVVVSGRQDGSKMGFKTANLDLKSQKYPLKDGVYLTETLLDGEIYPSITNFGNAPTFGASETKIETHIKADLGDLYGKEIVVYFKKYIRPIYKFKNSDELKEQLKKDMANL